MIQRCPHGKPLWCSTIHEHTDARVGQPLCAECYDYLGHVLFTWHLPELWRRFTIALRRNLTKHLKSQGVGPSSVKASFVKVVEMQARAIPHIHALIRLDPPEGHASTATDGSRDHNDHGPAATCGGGERRSATGPAWEPPISAAELATLIQQAARTVTLDVQHPDTNGSTTLRDTLVVRFGTQIDTQPLRTQNHTLPTESDTRRGHECGRRRAASPDTWPNTSPNPYTTSVSPPAASPLKPSRTSTSPTTSGRS